MLQKIMALNELLLMHAIVYMTTIIGCGLVGVALVQLFSTIICFIAIYLLLDREVKSIKKNTVGGIIAGAVVFGATVIHEKCISWH